VVAAAQVAEVALEAAAVLEPLVVMRVGMVEG